MNYEAVTTGAITIRVRTERGEEMDRALAVIRRMKGVSVVDAEHRDHFGVDLARAIECLCGYHGWTLLPSESNVDRALRLHAVYVTAREATREATAALDEGEFKEFRERLGR